MVAFVLRLNVYWMGKEQLFGPPLRGVMRWLGGITVNRVHAGNLVAASVAALQQAPGQVQRIVPPEGTRSKMGYRKTGFYYVALDAQVPIVMAYTDYERNRSELGPVYVPTGEVDADMAAIKAFYAPFKGRSTAQFHAGEQPAPCSSRAGLACR